MDLILQFAFTHSFNYGPMLIQLLLKFLVLVVTCGVVILLVQEQFELIHNIDFRFYLESNWGVHLMQTLT